MRVEYMQGVEADIEVYFNYAGKMLNGLWPYRDFGLEYPPGALPFFLLPGFLAGDLIDYRRFYMAEMMLLDLLGLWMINRFGIQHGFSGRHLYLTQLYYVTLPALIGIIAYQRFDFVPAVIVLGMVVLLAEGRRTAAWAMLGFGFAVKLFPVVLAPVLLIDAWKKNVFRQDLKSGIPAALTAAAVFWLPFMAAAGLKFWVFLKYHGQRGIQLESMYASLLLLAHRFGYPVSTEFSFGSWNIVSDISPFLASISPLVMIALILAVLVHYLAVPCISRFRRPDWENYDLPWLALLVILGFVIGGKVLSPQYLIWVMPLLVVAFRESSPFRSGIWLIFGILTILSYFIYPVNYKNLIDLGLSSTLLLTVRNSLLLACFYLILRSGRKGGSVSSEVWRGKQGYQK